MNRIPHTIFAPACNRPKPGTVLREAIAAEDNRKTQRWETAANITAHAMTFLLIVLGTIALAIV